MKKFLKKYGYLLSFFTCSIVSLFFIFSLLFKNVGQNTEWFNRKLNLKINRLVPQGWRFFTSSFREAQLIVYKKNNVGKFQQTDLHLNATTNFFGIKKKTIKIIQEIKFIKRDINDSLYINSEWNYQMGILGNIPKELTTVTNYFKEPLVCGEYLIVHQRIIPWAWVESKEHLLMPSKVIRLNITCP